MEIVLGIVIVVGGVLLASRSHSRKTPPKNHRSPNAVPLPSRGKSSVGTPEVVKQHPTPFDASSSSASPHRRALSGRAWIVDRDTLRINKIQIRLFGVDAPELDHPYGKKAKWALHGLCKGQTVRAEVLEEDAYGRTVARCTLPDGRDLSAEMVKLGMALDWPRYSGGRYGHLEVQDARKRLFLAAARQKGHMHVWKRFEERKLSK